MDLKKDFSELEGKKVDIYSGGEFKEVGVVAGCEYDIGITLLKEGGSKDDHIYCSRGPSAETCAFNQ